MGNSSTGGLWSHQQVVAFLHSIDITLIPDIIELIGSYVGYTELTEAYYKRFLLAWEVSGKKDTEAPNSLKQLRVELSQDIMRDDDSSKKQKPKKKLFEGMWSRSDVKVTLDSELRGHMGKVYGCRISNVPTRVISAANDGKVKIWDLLSRTPIVSIELKSAWVMTCDIAPIINLTDPLYVLSAGLDNMVTIHSAVEVSKIAGKKEKEKEKSKEGDGHSLLVQELAGHTGYVACARFLYGTESVISGSGDRTGRLWSVETGKVIQSLDKLNSGDIVSLELVNMNTCLFGDTNASILVADLRTGGVVRKFAVEHQSDVTSLFLCSDLETVLSGSEDGSCRLWDLGSGKEMMCMIAGKAMGATAITSAVVSASGNTCYAACDDGHIRAWESRTGKLKQDITAHQDRVACLSVSEDGRVLLSGAWDNSVKVWKHLDR